MSDGGYDRLASAYPMLERWMFGNALDHARRDACRFWSEHDSTPAAPKQILLVGDGRGHCLSEFALRFPHCALVSVDRSGEMLRKQQERMKRFSFRQSIRYVRVDACEVGNLGIAPEVVVLPFFTDHLGDKSLGRFIEQTRPVLVGRRLWWHLDFVPPRRVVDRVRGRLMTEFFNRMTDRPSMGVRDEQSLLRRYGLRRLANRRLHPMIAASIWTDANML